MKKGRRMDWEGRWKVEQYERETKKAESQRAIEKEETTSTEFPDVWEYHLYQKNPPAFQQGVCKSINQIQSYDI